MNFDTQVLDIVKPLLTSGNAEFVYGILFVEDASTTVGRSIYWALTEQFGLESVVMSQYSPANGFSYNIVAQKQQPAPVADLQQP
jgi:hypothetical protein|tara:strand:+ start:1176 stop:1430 length:255 start_codon:yes stop_codon:yes gene_type:complete